MNKRKQKVFSTLDSLTQKEIEEYITERKLNSNLLQSLDKIKRKRALNHLDRLSISAREKLVEAIEQYYKLGQAWVIAFVLECFYDEKYKIKDIKSYMKALIENDKELKEYVYEIMKDF